MSHAAIAKIMLKKSCPIASMEGLDFAVSLSVVMIYTAKNTSAIHKYSTFMLMRLLNLKPMNIKIPRNATAMAMMMFFSGFFLNAINEISGMNIKYAESTHALTDASTPWEPISIKILKPKSSSDSRKLCPT